MDLTGFMIHENSGGRVSGNYTKGGRNGSVARVPLQRTRPARLGACGFILEHINTPQTKLGLMR
jgi:hypothetical protein